MTSEQWKIFGTTSGQQKQHAPPNLPPHKPSHTTTLAPLLQQLPTLNSGDRTSQKHYIDL
jgi:hypothetical protein